MEQAIGKEKGLFSSYQVLLIVILAAFQFTHILDFMIISPLGAMLIRLLHVTPTQFGFVVSAYAFSAGIAGVVSAAFVDRFDRKKLMVFFYSGFIIGTMLCGIAPSYEFLLAGRIITGAFGGVLFAVTLTVVGDIFPPQVRGRVMGFLQMSFAVSQIAGIPAGLFIANNWGWHSTFLLIGALSVIILFVVVRFVQPINGHISATAPDQKPFVHLLKIVSVKPYLVAFGVTMLLSMSGFVVIPYMSTFLVYNVGLTEHQLPILYLAAGLSGLIVGPIAGKLADSIGSYKVFVGASIITSIMMVVFTQLSHTALAITALVNVGLMVGITGRIVSGMAMMTSVPQHQDRGAFMSINSSIQQMSAGLAAILGGLVVQQRPDGGLAYFGELGYISVVAVSLSAVGLYFVQRHIAQKNSAVPIP